MIASTGLERYDWVRRLGEAPRWWRDGLASCLPAVLRTRLGRSRSRPLVEPREDELVVYRETASGRQEQERLPVLDFAAAPGSGKRAPTRQEVVLRLPADSVLRREMELPLAVEEELSSMLRLGMDRFTPFASDQVYFDYRVTQRDRQAGRLRLELAVVPRSLADKWISALARHRMQPRAIDLAPAGEGFNLLPAQLRPRRSGVAHKLNWVLAVLVMLLLGAVVAVPLWQHRGVAVSYLEQGAEARREAGQAAQLRGELDRVLEATQFLVAKKHETRPMIEILDALTALLPDDTWVQQLEIEGGKVQIRGESKEATALVGLLAASPLFSNPVFRSPVTQNAATGRERFNLEIGVAEGAAE